MNILNLGPKAYAANEISLSPANEFSNLGKLTIPNIVSGGISLIMIVVSIVFFFILVIGGLKWITSGGDEKAVGAARAQITNALIGLAIIFSAWAIIQLINALFGINILGNLTIPTFNK